ncbi:MAG TPA: cupin domain-containing protein [Methylocella sp.]|nr:cupin domain-containing protein [Methylocella sp.]
MPGDLDQTAAAYALGLTRGAARAEVEERLTSDPELQAKVKFWQESFAVLDGIGPAEAPPAGLFSKILETIDAEEKGLLGTFTRRAGSGVWEEMAPGVTFTILFEDPVARRRSMLVRGLPGASIGPHLHEGGVEESLVLDGDLVIGDLQLFTGDYHAAVRGSTHPSVSTKTGCLIFMSTSY